MAPLPGSFSENVPLAPTADFEDWPVGRQRDDGVAPPTAKVPETVAAEAEAGSDEADAQGRAGGIRSMLAVIGRGYIPLEPASRTSVASMPRTSPSSSRSTATSA